MNYGVSPHFYEQHKDFSVYTSCDSVKIREVVKAPALP